MNIGYERHSEDEVIKIWHTVTIETGRKFADLKNYLLCVPGEAVLKEVKGITMGNSYHTLTFLEEKLRD